MKPSEFKNLRILIILAITAIITIIMLEYHSDDINSNSNVISLMQVPPKLRAVILILTHPHNQNRRQLQRETWIKDLNQDYLAIYLLANPDNLTWNSDNERNSFIEEFETFQDMIVFQNLEEGYRQISKKVIAGINYTMHGLPTLPDYVLKTDDDMYLNVENIEILLDTSPRENFYFGHLKLHQYAERYEYSKYYTSYDDWPTNNPYPPFAGGGLYLLSQDLALKVSELETNGIKYFPFEDVQMGILMHSLKVLPHHGNVAIASENPDHDVLAIHCGFRMHEFHEIFGKQSVKIE